MSELVWGHTHQIIFDVTAMGKRSRIRSRKLKKSIDKKLLAVRKRNAAYEKKIAKMTWNSKVGKYE